MVNLPVSSVCLLSSVRTSAMGIQMSKLTEGGSEGPGMNKVRDVPALQHLFW